MTKFSLPKGMKDILPEEMAGREYVCSKIKSVLLSYGFMLVEPSAIENFETLAAKSGPEIENEIYCFNDKSGTKLGLRFDLTVGMARMIADSSLPKPIKLACISNMWRYDNPQYGRYRSFWQWDAEIYGCSGMEADAEIISLTCDILESFGLDYEIKICSRKIIEGLLIEAGVPENKLLDSMRIMDKISKLKNSEIKSEFEKLDLPARSIKQILNFCSIKSTAELKKLKTENTLAREGIDEINKLFRLVEIYGKNNNCIFDMSIVRGIDYYTGIVYEATVKGENFGSVAGGGRYDNLLKIYGADMPATGIAGGIERLLLSLKDKESVAGPNTMVACAGEDVYSKSIEIAQKLRSFGIVCESDIMKRNFAKQLKYADTKKIPFVIIVGKNELAEKCVKLRDMKSGKEIKIMISDLEKIKTFL